MFAGFSLAVLTGIGFYFVYIKLPRRVQRFMEKHQLFTEVVSSLAAYWTLGGTITALFAAAWLGIIQSLIFFMLANPTAKYVLDYCMMELVRIKNAVVKWMLSELEIRKLDIQTNS